MKWISVKDKLPEYGKRVLVKTAPFHQCNIGCYAGEVSIGVYREKYKWCLDDSCRSFKHEVEYWMPLPE